MKKILIVTAVVLLAMGISSSKSINSVSVVNSAYAAASSTPTPSPTLFAPVTYTCPCGAKVTNPQNCMHACGGV